MRSGLRVYGYNRFGGFRLRTNQENCLEIRTLTAQAPNVKPCKLWGERFRAKCKVEAWDSGVIFGMGVARKWG